MSAAAKEPLGSAAQEAARLVDSLQDWFGAQIAAAGPTARNNGAPDEPDAPAATAGELPGATTGDRTAPGGAAAHPPSCRSCPVCRGRAYLQESHPDVLTHLAGAGEHLVAALRSLAAQPAAPGDAAGRSDRPPAPTSKTDGTGDPEVPSRAVRIDVELDVDPADASSGGAADPEPSPSSIAPSEEEPAS